MRLIDADKLLQMRFSEGFIDGNELLVSFNDVVTAIRQAPTVEAVEVRHGEWIRYPHGSGIFCTVCKHKRRYKDIRDAYCPGCGAKMDGEK